MNEKEWKKQHDIFENAFQHFRAFPYPVIGAINGYALGAGMEMILSCDIVIAASHAELGLPEVTIGIIPGVGGTQLLPRVIPINLAKEILLRGNRIDANYAKSIGLINKVVCISELKNETLKIAQDISKNAPLSLKSIKKAIYKGTQVDIVSALEIELNEYYKCAYSKDRSEGITAFNNKRKPNWLGE